jgi:hypothetical protein
MRIMTVDDQKTVRVNETLSSENDVLAFLQDRDEMWFKVYSEMAATDPERWRIQREIIRRVNACRQMETPLHELYEIIDRLLGTRSFSYLNDGIDHKPGQENRNIVEALRNPPRPAAADDVECDPQKPSTYADIERNILRAIKNQHCTAGQITRFLEIDRKDVADVLQGMVQEKKVTEKNNGVITAYFHPSTVPTRFWLDGDGKLGISFERPTKPCKHERTKKHGTDRYGAQRWFCGLCSRTWSEGGNRIPYGPAKPGDKRLEPRPKKEERA